MSYIQQPVLPLSFSVERLLQHSVSQQHSSNRKQEPQATVVSTGGGSLGSASDIESTPPSSPASSCNSIDSNEETKDMQSTTPTFGGQVVFNAAAGFATLPCIPLSMSTFTWHPAAAAAALQQQHPPSQLSYRLNTSSTAAVSPSQAHHIGTTAYQPLQKHLSSPGRILFDKPISTIGKLPSATIRNESSSSRDNIIHKPSSSPSEIQHRNQHKTQPKTLLPTNREKFLAAYTRTTPAIIDEPAHKPNQDDTDNESMSFKKKRTTFTSLQLESLEIRFSQQKYLTKHDRTKLATSLGLTEKHIKTWYQNRRTKWKRECSDEAWSKERETAAAAMYAQHLQLKSSTTNPHDNDHGSTSNILTPTQMH